MKPLLLFFICLGCTVALRAQHWPSFRGPQAAGVADGHATATAWDGVRGKNIKWKTPIPGLAHSSPVIWGEQVFVTTAVSLGANPAFQTRTDSNDPVPENARFRWQLFCLDKQTGRVRWSRTAHEGVPRVKRHLKATQANATPATDGRYVVALFGSEGLFCFDLNGRLVWRQDLGLLDPGLHEDAAVQWGAASSPVIYKDLAIVQADGHAQSFLAAYNLRTGRRVWRVERGEMPSWSTPLVATFAGRAELITNAPRHIRAYDPLTGKELWRFANDGLIVQVPTPFVARDLIFVTGGWPGGRPLKAFRPGGAGDLSLPSDQVSSAQLAWRTERGGPYVPTPLAYGDYLYVCNDKGVLSCHRTGTGEQLYQRRLDERAGGFSASPVAADGKLYFPSEDGDVYVLKAGPQFELLAVNPMGEPLMTTPAISAGVLFLRGQHHLFAIGPAGAAQTAQSNEGARRALDAALQTLGGLEQLQAITSLSIKAKGNENRSAEIQGYQPNAPTSGTHEETLAIFPVAGKLALDHRTDRHDGSVRHRRWLFAGDDRTVADFIVQGVFPRRNVSTETERARLARRVPHLLLLEAARHPATLQLLSNATVYEGRKHQALAWSPPNEKVRFRLLFDARMHLLSKCEYTMDYPGLGDTVIEYAYSNWRAHPQLGWFPANQAIKIGGKTFRRVNNREVTVNAPQAEDIFRLPELKRPQPAEIFRLPESFKVAEAQQGKVIEAAKGVYIAMVGSFNLMFVEFKDFVLAVEAPANVPNTDYLPADNQPGSTTLSESYIRKIKETVPNKPIRYLAVTHFHNDHAGGARAFLAEGATIVTTPGDKGLYERMAAAKYDVVPDRFSQVRRAARIESFARKRLITDGVRTVELLNTGATPHTAESIVVYLPQEKILYQGDLFYFDLGAEFPPKDRIIVMRPFARWLEKNGLAPEQIYQTHGIGFATMKHVTRILEAVGN